MVTRAVAAVIFNTYNVQAPSKVQAVQLLNISLRALHVSKQAPFARPLVRSFQKLLRETPVGAAFFASVAKPKAIKNILSQAYADATAVDDELVDCLLKPGLEPGAVQVFLDFIRCARSESLCACRSLLILAFPSLSQVCLLRADRSIATTEVYLL